MTNLSNRRRAILLGTEFVQDRKGKNIRVATFFTAPANPHMRPPTGNKEAARHARQQSR